MTSHTVWLHILYCMIFTISLSIFPWPEEVIVYWTSAKAWWKGYSILRLIIGAYSRCDGCPWFSVVRVSNLLMETGWLLIPPNYTKKPSLFVKGICKISEFRGEGWLQFPHYRLLFLRFFDIASEGKLLIFFPLHRSHLFSLCPLVPSIAAAISALKIPINMTYRENRWNCVYNSVEM